MRTLIYKTFYGLPLHNIVGIMALLAIVWILLARYFQKRESRRRLWKFGNSLMFMGMISIIIIITMVSRSEGTEVILIPFHSFIEARIQPEMYRSMLMNVFLFFPLGLTLPYALLEKWKGRVLMTILFALIFSVAIECLQYYFKLGRAETDDVICNTLGYTIGTIPYWLSNIPSKRGNLDEL